MPKYQAIWNALLSQASRSLPPTTLETYIQTLSLFLKTLLLPEPSNIAFTWDQLAITIKKCRPDVQRILAEVWSTVLRRFKADTRAEATFMLVEALDSIPDAIAWVYISTFQTTGSILHTVTTPLLTLLLDSSLRADDFTPIFILVRRVLNATMHYSTPDSFRPVAEILVSRVQYLNYTAAEEEAIHRTLQITLVVASLRKGKKAESIFTGDQIAAILSKLATIPLVDGLKEDIVAVLVACLKGSEMSIWVRGRAALEHVWEDTLSGYRAARALSHLDQSKGTNWKAFILPHVQRDSRATLPKENQYLSETLDLLHGLIIDDRLIFADEAFKASVEGLCRRVLDHWAPGEEAILQLRDVLSMVHLLPNLGRPLAALVNFLVALDIDTREDYQNSAANTAWCLGSSMIALSKLKGWQEEVDTNPWFWHCLNRYNWSSKVLEGLISISYLSSIVIPFTDALLALKPAIMSHIGALRYQALRFLASAVVEKDPSQNLAVNSCLQAESVEITSTRTPERVLKTTKLGTLTPVGQATGSTEICSRWLLAQLKVNLMPLWKATAQALGVLFSRCGEDVWPIFKAELDGIFDESRLIEQNPPWALQMSDRDEAFQEDEKTWRNPGLNETLTALGSMGRGMIALVKDQRVSERFDGENYEKQLLKTLEGSPAYAERHNRDIVPLFLSFASPELPKRPRMQRLISWLSLFAKFSNPKAAYASSSLHLLYMSLLSHPERTLQSVTVECLLAFNSKALKAHESTIRGLLDDSQWKDHLMGLDLAGTVEPTDRAEYVDFLIRLIYGMIRERRGRNKLHDRRAALLGALRQCVDKELGSFVQLMLEPFQIAENKGFSVGSSLPVLPPALTWKQQVGFLVLQAEVVRLLGKKLTACWPSLLQVTMSIVANAQRVLEEAKEGPHDDSQDDADSEAEDAASEIESVEIPHKVARNLRQLGIKRFTDYFRLAVDFGFSPYLPTAFDTFISPRLKSLETENTQSPSALMELFYTWSMRPNQVIYLVDYDASVLPKVIACLVATSVKPSVISRVLDIIENIITAASSNDSLVERLVKPHLGLLIDTLSLMIKESSQSGAITSELAQRQVHTLRAISDYVVASEHASSLLPLLLPLLQKPPSKVSETVKVDLLQVIHRLLSLLEVDSEQTTALYAAVYEIVSHLLQTLQSRQARVSAALIFTDLATSEQGMQQLSLLIKDLNAFDERRPEEPDFDRRLEAFATLNEQLYLHLHPRQWLPILHNMLHCMHDKNELSIRNNAVYSLRRFIQVLGSNSSEELQKLFSRVLFPGLKTGLRSKHETRYIKLVKEKSPSVKLYVRTVNTLLDNFRFSMEETVEVPQQDEDALAETAGDPADTKPSLSVKIADAVNNRLLPALLQFLEKREETEDTMRIPMAIGIAKVALHLPEEKRLIQVTRLMTILCQALRSKSSETRDLTRETLCKIVVSAGPPYLPILVRELRTALTRGPQLHILAVTSHSLVCHVTTPEASEKGFGNLDDIVGDVAEISAEVIFGQSGKDVQGEDFKTTYREVRSAASKGLDTLTILARSITLVSVARLLLPLRSIMHETESVKTMQIVEESLKRIAGGLNSNPSMDSKSLLSLCHALIGQNAKFLQEKPSIHQKGSSTRKNFVVQSKRDLPHAQEHYANNSYRFVAFGLELLIVAFRRNRFDYHDADIVSRLEPMVTLIGNTLYSTATPVVILGLKAISSIAKAPLKTIPKALPVIIHQQVEIVRQAGSAESEVAQASLKSLASTLRDCATAQLKEKDLKFVLEVMEPDLEETESQAAVFALLRAIVQRKLVVPEIYDMMDKVASVVVTNQSTQVQEMCRGILLQFLLDYPQGKGRLRKQMTFLASNLGYVFESGRLSVMVLLEAVFLKFEQKLVAEYADMFITALIMVLANDDSSTCRERASTLIKILYKCLEQNQRSQLVERLHVWVTQGAQGSLASVSAQVYGLVVDVAVEDAGTHMPVIVSDLNAMLEKAVERHEELTETPGDSMEVDLDWQTPYHALVVLCKALKEMRDPEEVSGRISWELVVDLMLFPHSWVRSACSKLLGSFYARKLVNVDTGTGYPSTRRGMVAVAKNSSIQLRSEHLDQAFSLQVVKNLVFLGKSFCDGINSGDAEAEEQEESDGDESKSSDSDEENQNQTSKEERIMKTPLPWLFSKLSYQVKTAHIKRRSSFVAPRNWHLEPLAVLQWFAAMVSYMDADSLERYLVHILTPVYRLSEDDTIRDSNMDELKTVAQELQDLVQSKVGVTKFTAIYGQIRQGTLAIRRERKAARAMTVASNPQVAAKRQIQRNVAKRESRKRKLHAIKEAKTMGHFPSKKKRME
ncbi:hypothetical protein M408DRAFT_7156 [Serendipita vermifera MAFF 305830]|uniref:Uncharacterized protein n=1 Tax=Serendipita vermifera MAFF 305830 TaxID=933852 RepID=A0A0C2WZ78_SERVB|nr:hypothetical protein M408DRAFT_7156 [Serendipita vermifera MAFF 305830]